MSNQPEEYPLTFNGSFPVNIGPLAPKEEIRATVEWKSDTPIIWLDRDCCDGMTQPDIIEEMMAQADREGYEPCDFNYAGVPNVYIRAWFEQEVLEDDKLGPSTWAGDGFVMNVREKVGK